MQVLADSLADRNLLFGMLAIQLDFVQRDALTAAVRAQPADNRLALGEILVRQRKLTEVRRQLLDALVDEQLELHQEDVEKCLAVLPRKLNAAEATATCDPDKTTDAELATTRSPQPSSVDPFLTIAARDMTSETGRFRIVRPHAKGGLGQVSIAIDEELHREVALKEIQPSYADHEQSRARFVLEAEITGNLEHPGIVPIYGLGRYDDGRPYYAMRFIRGDTLEEAVKRFHSENRIGHEGRPTHNASTEAQSVRFRKLLKSFVDACNAVAYAHSRGVLHRDLKPANIMLCRFSETLVVDWGLAKLFENQSPASLSLSPAATAAQRRAVPADLEESPLRPAAFSGSAPTQFGSAVGTPQYMSPEQAAGQLDQLGPASDVYSLGATLYFLLTCQSPFQGSDLATTLRRAQTGDFPPPRHVNRQVAPSLEAICLKAMSRRAEDRYATASALSDDVERWLADEPVMARVETRHERLLRWTRKHRALTEAAGVAVVLVATMALVTAGIVAQAWSHEAEARFEAAQLLAQEKLERENALRMTRRAEALQREAEAAHREAAAAHREAEEAHASLIEAQSELARQITHLGLEEQLRRSVQSKPLLWEIAADRIEPLFSKSRIPRANDRSMQTFNSFRSARAQRASSITAIHLLPLDEIAGEDRQLVEVARDFLARFYDLPVVTLKPLDREAWQAAGLDAKLIGDSPLRAVPVLNQLVAANQSGTTAVVGVTTHPLLDDDNVATFSQVHGAQPAALLSLAIGPSGQATTDTEPTARLRRVLKIATATAGAALGIDDYAAYGCGMNAAPTLADLDGKPLAFCPECEQKVWLLGSAEPLERYQLLVKFAQEHQLDAEAEFWQRLRTAVLAGQPNAPQNSH